MRTVAWLKAELSKFPDDALCFAYEGFEIGLVIEPARTAEGRRDSTRQGCIYCSEDDDYDALNATELLPAAVVPPYCEERVVDGQTCVVDRRVLERQPDGSMVLRDPLSRHVFTTDGVRLPDGWQWTPEE